MVYIVVPIFNTEKYLEQCLKSIHKQTYQNWKCLLVNDGSTDGCSQICETFANGDSRYVYIYEENKTSVYKGYKQDKIEMRGDRAEMSDFPLYLNTVAGGLDRRDQTIGGFSFVVKIYAVPVVEIIG